MGKQIAALLVIAALLGLSACGASEATQISEKAVGAIFINEAETLPESVKNLRRFREQHLYFPSGRRIGLLFQLRGRLLIRD